MKYTQGEYKIIEKKEIANGTYSFTVYCPDITEIACAGQFVHILPQGFPLRRPISICSIDRNKGILRIVFQVRGEGTKALSALNEGDMFDMLAPLGNGFKIYENKKAILVGGGIGTPPMLSLAELYKAAATTVLGFKDRKSVILHEEFQKHCNTIVCTDDGSFGTKGMVTGPLHDLLKAGEPDIIYACGPTPMLKKIAEIAAANNIECQVSLEERMGCGVGACLVCACKTVKNGENYSHVCKDGPVFNAMEVVWNG